MVKHIVKRDATLEKGIGIAIRLRRRTYDTLLSLSFVNYASNTTSSSSSFDSSLSSELPIVLILS